MRRTLITIPIALTILLVIHCALRAQQSQEILRPIDPSTKPTAPAPKRLLIIGQAKGYQHDSISSAMATLYDIGRRSGKWETIFKTECTSITKKPLKWGNKN